MNNILRDPSLKNKKVKWKQLNRLNQIIKNLLCFFCCLSVAGIVQ